MSATSAFTRAAFGSRPAQVVVVTVTVSVTVVGTVVVRVVVTRRVTVTVLRGRVCVTVPELPVWVTVFLWVTVVSWFLVTVFAFLFTVCTSTTVFTPWWVTVENWTALTPELSDPIATPSAPPTVSATAPPAMTLKALEETMRRSVSTRPRNESISANYTSGRMARMKMSVGNELASELGHDRDAMLRALAERVGAEAYLRGNELTLDGADDAVERARSVVDELAQLVAEGVSVGPQTVDAVAGVLTADGRAVDVLHDVVWTHRGKKVAPKTIGQKRYVDAIRANTVTFGIGPAGTGKTYLAIALAVAALAERTVARIILTRPAVEAGERLGFLPGDLLAKVDPYLRPLFDALHDMLEAERLASYMDKGMVEVAPLAFMRGRTLNDSFIILDEAQNTSPEQMQMFLTRLGFGSRVVVTGDITQIDLPRDQRSGLVHVMRVLDGVPDVAFVRFSDADVVRHKLVQRIVSAYAEHAEQSGEGARE